MMQWTGTLLRKVACLFAVLFACFRLRSGLGVRVKVRACDVVCPLDTAAVTEFWRLNLFSCTSSSFFCVGTLSSRGKLFIFIFIFFFAGGLVCLRADVSYLLFTRATKVIGDVCAQARFCWNSRQTSLSKGFSLITSMTLPLNYIFVLLLPYFTRPALNNYCFELENLIVTQTIALHNMADEGNEMSASCSNTFILGIELIE